MYESVVFLRAFILLLLSVKIDFYVDIEPFVRSVRDTMTLVIIDAARAQAYARLAVNTAIHYKDIPKSRPRTWRKTSLSITFTNPKMIDREMVLLEPVCGVASFDHISTFYIPEKGDKVIQLPLISCIDVHNDDKHLKFYYEVNLAYIKCNFPKILVPAFNQQLGEHYRFCLSCLKDSNIYNESYDFTVQNHYTSEIINRTVLEEPVVVPRVKTTRRISCAILELPLQCMTLSHSGRSSTMPERNTPCEKLDSIPLKGHLQQLETDASRIKDTSFMPPSINKITTTCATYGSLPCNTVEAIKLTAKDDLTASKELIQGDNNLPYKGVVRKISIATLTLPPENCMEQPVIEEDVYIAPNDGVSVTEASVKKDDEVDVEILPCGTQQISSYDVSPPKDKVTKEDKKRHVASKHISNRKRHHKVRIMKQKRTKRRAKHSGKSKSQQTPVPHREHRSVGLYNNCTSAMDGELRKQNSIVKHLRRACQLLIKRKDRSCSHIRKQFEELRHEIETKFHLVLCRCQERWDKANDAYIKRFNEIEDSMYEFELPRLENLYKGLPEPIRLQQPGVSVDSCLATLDKIKNK